MTSKLVDLPADLASAYLALLSEREMLQAERDVVVAERDTVVAERDVAVAQAAAQYHVALEINNSSFLHSRLGSYDNCLTIATAVRDAGGWVSLGSDSHYAGYLGNFDKSLALLEAVDFPPERILNQSPRVLLDFLESRGWAKISEFSKL